MAMPAHIQRKSSQQPQTTAVQSQHANKQADAQTAPAWTTALGSRPAPALTLQRFSSSDSSRSSSSEGSSQGSSSRSSESSESSDAGDGGAGGSAGGSCTIDVRATHIGGILSGVPIWHLFIVYTNASGTPYYYRGGPGGSCPGVTGGHGTIRGTHGPYVPGTVDWDPGAPSTTVESGPGACGKDSCFASELSRIDSTCTPYSPTGPNSNTVVSTLLNKCGVTRRKPVAIAPGWGDPDI